MIKIKNIKILTICFSLFVLILLKVYAIDNDLDFNIIYKNFTFFLCISSILIISFLQSPLLKERIKKKYNINYSVYIIIFMSFLGNSNFTEITPKNILYTLGLITSMTFILSCKLVILEIKKR